MKKVFWVSALCMAVLGAIPSIAQEENSNASPYYYVNVPIERIYPYKKGYVVDYRTGSTGTMAARTYLPLEWFQDRARNETGAPPKGEVIYLGPGSSYPYLTVYYKDGEFSHVRLYLRRERSHISWGSIRMGEDLDSHFEDVSDLKLVF
ncbi:MAG: hypothetical protein LBG73_01450 [Spirochaetaceae bacterium]|jgi:hypothetical protein|nr:hypothetical protein [Spirochaetaceae bacterium]